MIAKRDIVLVKKRVRGNRGSDAANPRTPITKRKPTNTVQANQHANKGDVVVAGKLCRPLTKRG